MSRGLHDSFSAADHHQHGGRDQEYERDGVNHSLETVNQHTGALTQPVAGGLASGIHGSPILLRTQPGCEIPDSALPGAWCGAVPGTADYFAEVTNMLVDRR
jgi:hypothetical protein